MEQQISSPENFEFLQKILQLQKFFKCLEKDGAEIFGPLFFLFFQFEDAKKNNSENTDICAAGHNLFSEMKNLCKKYLQQIKEITDTKKFSQSYFLADYSKINDPRKTSEVHSLVTKILTEADEIWNEINFHLQKN